MTGAEGDDPVVDPSVLGALAARLGQRAPAFLSALLDTWEKESAQRLEEVQRAVAEGQVAAVGRLAHSLRGSSAAIGAVRLASACNDAEQAIRSGESVDLPAAQERLRSEVAQARTALGALFRT